MKKGRGQDLEPGDVEVWRIVARTVKPYHAPPTPEKKPTPKKKTASSSIKQAESPPLRRSSRLPIAPVPISAGFDAATERHLKRGRLPVEGRLDLHGCTQAEAFRALYHFIETAYGQGKRNLLVITGKGIKPGSGVLRRLFPLWLEEGALRSMVLAFSKAQPKDGGEGAFYVRLRKSKK
jgi:DNA-nicking Smr family endonuclease